VWRLVLQNVASLEELDGKRATYSYCDVMKANAWLDFKADFEAQQVEGIKKK
jgi:hypothetical protein